MTEGRVAEGDAVSIVARPNPGWTIARVALVRKSGSPPAVAAEIASLAGLGSDWAARFRERATGKA